MAFNESNNSFFSWEGTIGRKDYAINMFILVALFIGLSLINFDVIAPEKITNSILLFIVGFLKFIIVMSVLSVIYRRIADFSIGRSYKFQKIAKSSFGIFIVFPILYLYIVFPFLMFMPIIANCLAFISLILGVIGIIVSIIICFIKSK
ncbi:hypothetical protein IJ182_11010 [bacterium]|nr:hypothetical protein [bacterium]